jgi:hypothetical protein
MNHGQEITNLVAWLFAQVTRLTGFNFLQKIDASLLRKLNFYKPN